MKRTIKWLIALIIIVSVITTLLFASCKTSTEATETEEATETGEVTEAEEATETGEVTEAEEATEEKEPVELKIIHWMQEWPGEEGVGGLLEIYRLFEEKYPWITISQEMAGSGDDYRQFQMTNLQLGADGADIQLQSIGPRLKSMVDMDAFVDLTQYPECIENFDQEYIKTTAGYDGGVYATIVRNGVAGWLVYNPIMLEENGVSVPQNIEELYEAFDTFVSKGISPLVVGGKDQWPYVFIICPMASSFILDKDPDYFQRALTEGGTKPFTDEGGYREIVEEIKYMVDEGYIDPASASYGSEDSINAFVAGQNPFIITTDALFSNITQKDPDLDFGVSPAPFFTEEQGLVMVGNPDPGWAINAKSEHIEEAALFLTFFHENFEIFNKFASVIPALKGVDAELLESIPHGLEMYNYMNDAKLYPIVHAWYPDTTIETETYTVVSGIAAGATQLEDGLATLEKMWEESLPDLYSE